MKTTHYPDLDANPDFARLEEETLTFWQETKAFAHSVADRPQVKADGTSNHYVFYDGPPFANGLPHYGHLLTGFVKDAIARYHTMKGQRVERRFGWDCHGLPAEMGAEKELGISGRVAIHDYGIAKFNDYCRTSVMKYTVDWESYVTRQGRWVDFVNDYKTLDTNFMESVLWAFKQLYEKGLVYESFRVMPYSWAAETPLSNFETRMDNATREREDKAAYVKFKLSPESAIKLRESGAPPAENYYLIAWTTTPWTLPCNLALAVSNELLYSAIGESKNSPLASSPPEGEPKSFSEDFGGGYHDILTQFARELCKEATPWEQKLWAKLKSEQLGGFKFRRQQPIGHYIADFYNADKQLIIELDGGQHADSEADKARDAALAGLGYQVLRFWNNEVDSNLDGICTRILQVLQNTPHRRAQERADSPSGGEYASCYFVVQSAAAKFAESLKAEMLGAVNGSELLNLAYEPLFPYFADTPNAFRVLDGSEFVTDGDGTGIVHMAPGFGEVDQKCCAENGIAVMVPVDEKGRYTDAIYDLPDIALSGLNVIAETAAYGEGDKANHIAEKDVEKFGLANMRILRWLKAHGALAKDEVIKHNYPHCWRTDTPVIYRAMSSWYVAVTKFRDRAVELNREINWIPEHVRDGQMGHMLATAPDWSISRNRFWGTPIPIWRSNNPDSKAPLKVFGSIAELEAFFGVKVTDLHRPFIDALKAPDGAGFEYSRVEDVFDCWFESGSMPFAQLHYPFENKQQFEENFPADFITEYIGQTRGWFNTLIMLSTALFDKAPFKNCICHGVVIDAESGLKYSKRLKNYRDPREVMDVYGADALRWMMLSSPVMRAADLAVDPDGKFIRDVVRLTIKPLWSAYNFFTLYANADGVKAKEVVSRQSSVVSKNTSLETGDWRPETPPLDRYILAKCKAAVAQVRASMDAYETTGATDAITGFFDVLNNWYIRRSRPRFWGEEMTADKQAAYDTLFTVLNLMVRAAAPLLPFTTEVIYQGLHAGAKSIHLTDFPDVSAIDAAAELVADMDRVRDACTAMGAIRSAQNIRNRQPLASATLYGAGASRLKPFSGLMEDELNVKEIRFADTLEGVAEYALTIHFPIAGKRLGAKMKAVGAAAKAGDWKNENGVVTVGGERMELGEYHLQLKPLIAGAQPMAGNDALVVLDLVITPELEAEGRARDLVRMIQQARKDSGLHVADRITLALDVPAEFEAAIATHSEYIREQTLANTIAQGSAAATMKVAQELDGAQFVIGLSKVA